MSITRSGSSRSFQLDFETFLWWDSHNSPEKSVLMSHYSHIKELPPHVQSKFAFFQFMQPRTQLVVWAASAHFWLQLFIHQYPQSSSGLLSIHPSPSLYWYWWLPVSNAGAWPYTWSFWTSWWSNGPHLSSLSQSLWMAYLISSKSDAPLSLLWSQGALSSIVYLVSADNK